MFCSLKRLTCCHVPLHLQCSSVAPLLLWLPQADKDAAVESTIAGLESRCVRLAAELEDAAVALEVCRAKAGMYDDLQAKAERLVSPWEAHSRAAAAAASEHQLTPQTRPSGGSPAWRPPVLPFNS